MDTIKTFISQTPTAAKDDDEEALLKLPISPKGGRRIRDSSRRRTHSGKDEDDAKSDTSGEGDPGPPPTSALAALTKSLSIASTLFKKMFRQTTCTDKLILFLGTILAFIHGFTFPFVAVLFGSLTNSYIQQATHGFASNTTKPSTGSTPAGGYGPEELYNFATQYLNISDKPAALPNATELGISTEVAGTLELINKIMAQTFSKEQVLTKDEFANYVHTTGLLFCVLAVGIFLCSFLQYLCWELVAVNQTFRLREEVIRNILRQDMTWFVRHNTNELLGNIYSEVERVREGVGFKFSTVLEYIATFVAVALISLGTSYRLALVFLVVTPFIMYRILTFVKMLAAESAEASRKWNKAEQISSEALQNIDTVVAYGEQENEINRYGEGLEESLNVTFKQFHLSAMGNASLTAIIYGCYAVAFWYSCKLLMDRAISPGEIYTIFLSITMGSIAIQNLSIMIPTVSNSFQASKHLGQYIDRIPEIKWDFSSENLDSEDTDTDKHIFAGDIEFKNVHFRYPGAKAVLKDLSFKIKGGQTVAIVGEAGSGKSTIAYLLLRLYDPVAGEISINETNMKSLEIPTLRSNATLSVQGCHMSHKAVHKNIRAGRSHIGHKKLVGIMDFISHVELSELKKVEEYTALHLLRKIDLARALVTDPPILILDESFSALLPNERQAMLDKILQFRKGKTTIVLTSHFVRVKDVDKIYVLQDGHILPDNIGSHEELMGKVDSAYARMVNAETKLEQLKGMARMSTPITSRPERSVHFVGPMLRFKEQTVSELIFSLITPETKKMWAIAFLGCLITGCQMTVLSAYFVQIFGTFSTTGPELASAGIFWAGMLLILAVVAGLGIWLRHLFAPTAGVYLMLGLKVSTFASVLRRPKAYFDKTHVTPTDLGIKMMRNAQFIRSALETPLPDGVSALVTILFICILMCVLVWQIGLIALFGVLPIILLLAVAQYEFQKRARRSISKIDDKSSDIISKALHHMKLTQAFCMQRSYLKKYLKHAKTTYRESTKQAIRCSMVAGICESIFFLFCGVSFVYGAFMIQMDTIDPQALFKIFFAVAFCAGTFRLPVAVTPGIAEAVVSLEQINDLINEEASFESSLDALNDEGEPLESVEGGIEFEDVDFEYSARKVVLNDFDLSIPARSTVGLTGQSGFGGSTILQLIERFYDPTATGNLCLDGSDYSNRIRNFNIRHLREHIAWIPQEISLFSGSLAYNIKYGCKDKEQITTEQLLAILDTVKLGDDFKLALDIHRDSNYWTNLSRGRKVQIAMARAVARSPKILLIDSPTNSLSAEEEVVVLAVLNEIKKNRTTVIASKSPSTLALADNVAVISDGKVVQQGKINEVLTAHISASGI